MRSPVHKATATVCGRCKVVSAENGHDDALDHFLHFLDPTMYGRNSLGLFGFLGPREGFRWPPQRDRRSGRMYLGPELVDIRWSLGHVPVKEISNHFRRNFFLSSSIGPTKRAKALVGQAARPPYHPQRLLVNNVFPDGVSDFHATPAKLTSRTPRKAAISPTC